MSPGFRLISVVPGSWEFWGPVPVLVPVPVDSPAELLEVLVEKPDRFRRCFWGIPESDLDRIDGSDESRFGDFGHSADSTVPEFLDLDLSDDSDESRFGEFGHSADSTVPEFLDLDLIDDSDESRFGEFGYSADSAVPEFDLDRIKAGPADSGSVGLLENRPSDSRLDSSGS